ncbi:hypothetical protein GGS20DRAFT_548887 [Poronia punctata]|nr:hypothetical protein GGS20DRAFT_548887 [Poronia punctata]
MGRTEPTIVKPPAAFRRDARAKRARATINKVIPGILTTHPRARRGVENSELIIDPPRFVRSSREDGQETAGETSKPSKNRTGKAQTRRIEAKEARQQYPKDRDGHHLPGSSTTTTTPSSLHITLQITDPLTAAQTFHHLSKTNNNNKKKNEKTNSNNKKPPQKIGILNMASPLSPGGGFLNGSTTSQEESLLCMRTTLLPSLRDEFYRLPELGIVYTPDVLVFASSPPPPSSTSDTKDGEETLLPKNDRWYIDVLTSSMLRHPETTQTDHSGHHHRHYYTSKPDRELATLKMRAVMRVFASKGCTHVILGAWGCGVYGNPVSEIAKAWRRVLLPVGQQHHKNIKQDEEKEDWASVIENVVFAIQDLRLATCFSKEFGEDVLHLPVTGTSFSSPGEGEDGDVAGDPVEVARVREVRDKIEELEIRMGQVKSPHLRDGLENVLAGLRKQLPIHDDRGEDEDDDSDVSGDHEG